MNFFKEKDFSMIRFREKNGVWSLGIDIEKLLSKLNTQYEAGKNIKGGLLFLVAF